MDSSVTIRLPRQLWLYSGGAKELPLEVGTLRDAFRHLQQTQPLAYERICTESGQPRDHVNVFVNRELVRDLDSPVQIKPGDVITILPAISGG